MWIEDEQNSQNTNNNSQDGNASAVGGGGGSGVIGGPTAAPTNTKPQSFASVQDYLKGNQTQAADLGQKFNTKLTDSSNQIKSSIDTAADQAKNDINAGTVNFNPDLASTATTNPTALTSNPDQLSSYLKQWNASYGGPTSFETSNSYSDAVKAANDANTKAVELNDTGGREQLLQDEFGVYGQGNKGLDEALLQTSPTFADTQGIQKQFGSIKDYLASKSNEINRLAPQAATNTQQTQDLTRNQFNQGLTDFGNQVTNEKNQVASAGANAANDPASNLLSRLPANPTDVDLAQFGLTRSEYQGILESLPNKSTDPNISNPLFAANPQYKNDLAKYLAMQDLQKKALASQL